MSYLGTMTTMLSDSKNPEHERHIYEIHSMVLEMIKELVPPLVRECYNEINVDVSTYLNGRSVSGEGLREYIREIIIDELRKGFM